MNLLIATQSSHELDIYLTVVNRYLCLNQVAQPVLDMKQLAIVVHLLQKINIQKHDELAWKFKTTFNGMVT